MAEQRKSDNGAGAARLWKGRHKHHEQPRSLQELAHAIVYLEMMERESKSDPVHGEIVGRVARKGMEILLWAGGEENRFGELVARFAAEVNNAALTASTDQKSKGSAKP